MLDKDRLNAIERLAALRDAGGLSAEEFEREKAQILSGSEPSLSDTISHTEADSEQSKRGNWTAMALLTAAASAIAVGGVYFALPLTSPKVTDSVIKPSKQAAQQRGDDISAPAAQQSISPKEIASVAESALRAADDALLGAEVELAALASIENGPPTSCPEREDYGQCFYDNGWQPKLDNPLFSPLQASDTQGSGATCWATNSRGETLLSYEVGSGPSMRIDGKLVQFQSPSSDVEGGPFSSPEGVLQIIKGPQVSFDVESAEYQATIVYAGHSGEEYRASARFGCGA